MTYITISTPTCFSHAHDFEVLEDVIDDLSRIKYDGEGKETLLRHGVAFLGFYERNEVHSDDTACGLFTYMFDGHVDQWCCTLLIASIHSYDHMIEELICAFYCYDRKALNKKFVELWKETDESIAQFWDQFCNIAFQIPKDEIDLKFLKETFQYLLHVS